MKMYELDWDWMAQSDEGTYRLVREGDVFKFEFFGPRGNPDEPWAVLSFVPGDFDKALRA